MEARRGIYFTREELEVLQSAFEVLIKGGHGTYQMLRLPEVVAIHQRLFEKFDDELKAMQED